MSAAGSGAGVYSADLDALAAFFGAFSDGTRLKILVELTKGERCVQELADTLSLSQSAVSHQLQSLRAQNIVKFRRVGKSVRYSVSDGRIKTMISHGVDSMGV